MPLLRYFSHMLLVLPCMPLLFFQSIQLRKRIPILPDAEEPEGTVDSDSKETLRILILGESTVAGVGVKKHANGLSGAIAHTLADKLKVNVSWTAYGRSGYTARKIFRETVPEMKPEKVDLVAIALGGNDAFELNTPWGWRRDARKLIHALQSKYPQSTIAFMHMPPIREFPAFTKGLQWALGTLAEIFGDVLASEVKRHPKVYFHHEVVGLKVWNERMNENLPIQAFFSDGVHPSSLNYGLWGEGFANWMIDEKILSENGSHKK